MLRCVDAALMGLEIALLFIANIFNQLINEDIFCLSGPSDSEPDGGGAWSPSCPFHPADCSRFVELLVVVWQGI